MKKGHLKSCQIETPADVVRLMWKLALAARRGKRFANVVDLGAGDARFARVKDSYDSYLGVEVDASKGVEASLPKGAKVLKGDAMDLEGNQFDLCIGNPPYIRHHNLNRRWREKVQKKLQRETGVRLKGTANLFVYFLMQSLLRTTTRGLVIQLVPFEWVTRPSAQELRDYISSKGWDVRVYRFDSDIFPTVLTTASITIVDKSKKSNGWTFGEIGRQGLIRRVAQPSGSSAKVLGYTSRDEHLHALRGLSPGGQEIFVLTEEERLKFSLKKARDVVPSVTSLRSLPKDVQTLDEEAFNDYYVSAGKRCWLIRSDKAMLSKELQEYVRSVGNRWKAYSTCTVRAKWWRYKAHPVPAILMSSGFTGRSPKTLRNAVGAVAVGSVYGVFAKNGAKVSILADKLRKFDFQRRVVHHSNDLKKIEVHQLNSVLQQFFK